MKTFPIFLSLFILSFSGNSQPFSRNIGLGAFQLTNVTGLTSAYSAQELRFETSDLSNFVGLDVRWMRANMQDFLSPLGVFGFGGALKFFYHSVSEDTSSDSGWIWGAGGGAYHYRHNNMASDLDYFATLSAKYYGSWGGSWGYFLELAYMYFPYMYREVDIYGSSDNIALRHRIDFGLGLLFDWGD